MAAVAKKIYYSNTSKIILFNFFSSFPEKSTYDNVATVAKSPPRGERRALSLKQSSLDHRQIIDDLTYMYFEGGGKH